MSGMTGHRPLGDVRDAPPGPSAIRGRWAESCDDAVLVLVQSQCRGRPAGEPDELAEDQGDQQDTDQASRQPREVPSSNGANPCGPMLSHVANTRIRPTVDETPALMWSVARRPDRCRAMRQADSWTFEKR